MAGHPQRPSYPAIAPGGASSPAPRPRSSGSLRERLAALRHDQSPGAAPAGVHPRRRDDDTIRSLGEWIDEINRQPAVYDTGIRITTPDVWPPAPDGGPRTGLAPWKLARRRELASRYGPLLAVAALTALYFGYDAVLKRNAGMTQGAVAETSAPAARLSPFPGAPVPQDATQTARPAFRLTVGPLTAGKPSPINISATGAAVSGDAVFVFSGLPSGAKLSAGTAADGKWAVAPRELSGLTLTPPAGHQGELGFDVSLLRDGTRVLHEEHFRLPVVSAGTPASQPAITAAAMTSPRVVTGEKGLLARGKAMMEANDIAGARLVYQHLAIQGSTAGALALARSYDAAALTRIAIGGETADAAKAEQWYERAAEYGSAEAQTALIRLRAARR